MSNDLLKIIESQQETINMLTRLLELELARKAPVQYPNSPNIDWFKYGEMRPTCGYQPLAGSGYGLGSPPQQE